MSEPPRAFGWGWNDRAAQNGPQHLGSTGAGMDSMTGEVIAMLGWGLMNSVLLFLVAAAFGFGLARLLVRISLGAAFTRQVVGAWVAIFQTLPLLVLLVLIHGALPYAGIRLSGFAVAVIGLACVFSAAIADAVLLAMRHVSRAEHDGALILGAPSWLIEAEITLPQAWRRARGELAARGMGLAKDTSLASVVAMPELLHQALDAEERFSSPAPLIAAALLYLVILLPARYFLHPATAVRSG